MNSVFSSKVIQVVRQFLCDRCATSGRVTREEVAEYLASQGFDVDAEDVASMLRKGVVNTKNRAFALFRGRYGSIREVDLEETARVEAERKKNHERAMKAWETRRRNLQAAESVATPVEA